MLTVLTLHVDTGAWKPKETVRTGHTGQRESSPILQYQFLCQAGFLGMRLETTRLRYCHRRSNFGSKY